VPTESHRRVGLLGPVLPFRSGIAQHTTRLQRALRRDADLVMLSFSRQYPAWLFPGESDRDPFHAGHVEPGVEYSVDSLNPLTWRAAVDRFTRARVEAVIVPWWTAFFAPLVIYLRHTLAARGVPVVFLCHNVIEHDAARYKRELTRIVLRGARAYCVQSQSEARELSALLPEAEVVVHAHPLYDQYPASNRQLTRRAPLELLFFGVIRPYKGLDILLQAMALLVRQDVHLSVVGEFWKHEAETRKRITELGIAGKVELIPRYVDEQEAANYFSRADAVVLPYRSASGSGVIPMAYHYDKPVIATRVGGLVDAIRDGRTGILVDPTSPRALAEAIDRFDLTSRGAMQSEIRAMKSTMTWEGLAATLLQLTRRRAS
jgi:glycosyltransferase involved in cell wall biosynthesis